MITNLKAHNSNPPTTSSTKPKPTVRQTRERRYLALWFPYLPTDRLARLENGRGWRIKGAAEKPRLLVASIKSAQRVTAVNQSAEALAITPGQTLSDVRAQYADIEVMENTPDADQSLLETIAGWANRYTPLVALDHMAAQLNTSQLSPRIFRYGLILDVSGCTHLFASPANPDISGEQHMIQDIKNRLHAQGFHVEIGLAGTVGAAWALSRFSPGLILAKGAEKAALSSLPIAALRIDQTIELAMNKVGLKRLQHIIDQPAAPLANRFGLDLIRQLNRALGNEEESISPQMPVATLMAERRFHEPINNPDVIEAGLYRLAETLSIKLETRCEGARRLTALLFQSDGGVTRADISTASPTKNAHHIATLFHAKLATALTQFSARHMTETEGFDVIRLCVLESEPLSAEQITLNTVEKTEPGNNLAHLIDKLAIRFGMHNIIRLVPQDRPLPEEANLQESAVNALEKIPNWPAPPCSQPITRPTYLLDVPEEIEAVASVPEGPPLRFRWRRLLYNVKRVEGPERLCAPWWHRHTQSNAQGPYQQGFTRDYFRIEDEAGQRFWLFRDGLYQKECSNPRWYLHGLFT